MLRRWVELRQLGIYDGLRDERGDGHRDDQRDQSGAVAVKLCSIAH